MTKEEKRIRAKKRANLIGDVEEIALKGGAIMILFRLLYKKKIRPLTAAFLAIAMRFCNDEVTKMHEKLFTTIFSMLTVITKNLRKKTSVWDLIFIKGPRALFFSSKLIL